MTLKVVSKHLLVVLSSLQSCLACAWRHLSWTMLWLLRRWPRHLVQLHNRSQSRTTSPVPYGRKLWWCAAHSTQWYSMALCLACTRVSSGDENVPSKNQMHFRQCGVSVPISCYSAAALQLRHQCLCTAPSHVVAAEMPSRPLCDSGCSGIAGGRKCPRLALVQSWQRLWPWTLPG